MPDAVDFIKTVKRTALDTVKAEKPVEIFFGKVTGIKPLNILVEQKLNLGEKQLALTRNVTDFKTKISGDDIQTYYSGGETGHTHAIGKIEITVHNGLETGDNVILLRQQGGQKYIVWDRIV